MKMICIYINICKLNIRRGWGLEKSAQVGVGIENSIEDHVFREVGKSSLESD